MREMILKKRFSIAEDYLKKNLISYSPYLSLIGKILVSYAKLIKDQYDAQ